MHYGRKLKNGFGDDDDQISNQLAYNIDHELTSESRSILIIVLIYAIDLYNRYR